MRNNAITRAMRALEEEITKLEQCGGATNVAAAERLAEAYNDLANLDAEGR